MSLFLTSNGYRSKNQNHTYFEKYLRHFKHFLGTPFVVVRAVLAYKINMYKSPKRRTLKRHDKFKMDSLLRFQKFYPRICRYTITSQLIDLCQNVIALLVLNDTNHIIFTMLRIDEIIYLLRHFCCRKYTQIIYTSCTLYFFQHVYNISHLIFISRIRHIPSK
jgi:hypothetical protein